MAGGSDELRRRPMISIFACPLSPLKLIDKCCGNIIEAARGGVTVVVIPMAMAGCSAPVTLAGTLVTHNAEVLACITLGQLTVKGSGIIYGSASTSMDLRRGTATVGSPELGLVSAGVAQPASHYGLPSWVAGVLSDSKVCDAQTGHEKTFSGIMAALAGANVIYALGMIESGLTFDFSQLVVDAEIALTIKRMMGGIPIIDEVLAAVDAHATRPTGSFRSAAPTSACARNCDNVQFADGWVRDERKRRCGESLHARALAETRRILATYTPEPLPEDTLAAMQEVIAQAASELGASHAQVLDRRHH